MLNAKFRWSPDKLEKFTWTAWTRRFFSLPNHVIWVVIAVRY